MKIPISYFGYLKAGADFLVKESTRFTKSSYYSKIVTFFALLGAYHFTKSVISLGSFSLHLLFRRRMGLLERYGPNSYVLITGAAQGIGKAYATRFIQMGFNLVIIDKDIHTLKATEKELQQLSPTAKVISLVLDLSQIETNISTILSATEKLDISIVINDAGKVAFGPFEHINRAEMIQMTRVNVLAPLILTREFIGRLRNRSKRSAIITMSSFFGVYPSKHFAAYAATKAFLRFLSLSIEQENRDKIDCLVVTPGLVATQMTHLSPSWKTITPEECVDGVLRDLGRRNETMGNWKQVTAAGLLHQMPNVVTDTVIDLTYIDLQAAARSANPKP